MFTSHWFGSIIKLRSVAIVVSIVIGMLGSSSAIALEVKSESVAVPQSVLNLDLCTLAYQLYHQSLCLPLDPWYDTMSRLGSDRRTNICRFTHGYAATLGRHAPHGAGPDQGFYSGPNAARDWTDSNANLDPILTNYKHLDTRLPAFTRDGERYLAVVAPDYVTKDIKAIDAVRYKTKPTSFPNYDIERVRVREYPSGEDHLIVFEGGTGIAGTTQPAWSLMGFVLMHKTSTGHDAYIVFRGSRSGSALATTVWKAQDAIGDSKGNPDWITDLRGTKQIESPLISKVGKVTQGFAESLPTMLGPIAACCKYLEQNYPAPEHIYVTGHSLGAGLASQFVSAVLQGSFGDELRKEVKGWPWDRTTLVAFAQPIPGDPTWAAQFDKNSPVSAHYWVEGDDVVEATSNRIVGLFIDKGQQVGAQRKLGKIAGCADNPHEVFVIRAAMVRDLPAADAALSQQLGQQNTWAYYDSFLKMLSGQPKSYVYPGAPAPKIVTEQNLRKVLQNYNFGPEFDLWLEQVYARMIADKSSYIGPKFQSTLDERGRLVLNVVNVMRKPPLDNAQELDNLVNEFKVIDGNLGLTNEEQWIFSALILSRLQRTNLSLQELLSKPEIKNCLEANVN